MAAAPQHYLTVETVRCGDDVLLALTGELDLATANLLVDQANTHLKPGPGILTLDLTGVTFCDTTGLRAIIAVHQDCERAGWKCLLIGLTAPVHRTVELTGLRDYLNIRDASPHP